MKGEAAWMRPEEPRAGWNMEKRTDFSKTPQKTLCQVEETRPEFPPLPRPPLLPFFNVDSTADTPPPHTHTSHVAK